MYPTSIGEDAKKLEFSQEQSEADRKFSQWFKDGTNYGAHNDDFIRWYGTL